MTQQISVLLIDITAYVRWTAADERVSFAAFLANVNSCSCSLYVVVRPSVVCLSSVTFVHPTQPIEIFGNTSPPCNTLVT